jgi:hypothetical protein
MATFLYFLFTAAHIALFAWGMRLWPNNGRKLTLLLTLLPIGALIYDNGVIGIGRFIGEGDFLLFLNQGRFLLHAIITPMLIAATAALADQAGVGWAKQRASHILFGILTLALIIVGLLAYTGFVYEPEQFGNTLRYVDTAAVGPPISAVVTIIVITLIAIFIWRTIRWPWLFVAGLIMFIGSAIPPSVVGPAVGSGAEVILLGGLLATASVVGKRG